MLVAIATLLLPALACASEHKSAAHGSHESSHGSHEEAEAIPEDTSALETVGIELGEYKIRTDYPVQSQKSTVRFVLYAAVKGEHSAAMRDIVEAHRQKIRDLVITSTRLAPLILFEEPDFASFRRRLIIRLRRTFPELAVEDLYISDFGLMVKSL
jgi:hypothetical protein